MDLYSNYQEYFFIITINHAVLETKVQSHLHNVEGRLGDGPTGSNKRGNTGKWFRISANDKQIDSNINLKSGTPEEGKAPSS